jgi:hypothetical protein
MMSKTYWASASSVTRRVYAAQRNRALGIACPDCGVARLYPCRFPNGNARSRPHQERISLGQEAFELERRLEAEDKIEAMLRKKRPVTAEDMDAWLWRR